MNSQREKIKAFHSTLSLRLRSGFKKPLHFLRLGRLFQTHAHLGFLALLLLALSTGLLPTTTARQYTPFQLSARDHEPLRTLPALGSLAFTGPARASRRASTSSGILIQGSAK